jgi:hypothetical protein
VYDFRSLQGIKWIYVRTGAEAFAVLEKGRRNLRYACTNVNATSSRSHFLFSMKLIQYDSGNSALESTEVLFF